MEALGAGVWGGYPLNGKFPWLRLLNPSLRTMMKMDISNPRYGIWNLSIHKIEIKCDFFFLAQFMSRSWIMKTNCHKIVQQRCYYVIWWLFEGQVFLTVGLAPIEGALESLEILALRRLASPPPLFLEGKITLSWPPPSWILNAWNSRPSLRSSSSERLREKLYEVVCAYSVAKMLKVVITDSAHKIQQWAD